MTVSHCARRLRSSPTRFASAPPLPTPIYTRHPWEIANAASFIHEVSGGRFILGAGVSHAPTMTRFGLEPGKPLADMRRFVEALRSAPRAGELPPIMPATLRRKMIRPTEEIADGLVFANAPLSSMGDSLSALSSSARHGDFFIGNMIPTCVNEDKAAAADVNRKTLTYYAMLPNYRNYWREAGYDEEMAGVEAAMRVNDMDGVGRSDFDRVLRPKGRRQAERMQRWLASQPKSASLVVSSAQRRQAGRTGGTECQTRVRFRNL